MDLSLCSFQHGLGVETALISSGWKEGKVVLLPLLDFSVAFNALAMVLAAQETEGPAVWQLLSF